MGLFDIFKSKKILQKDIIEKLKDYLFPKGKEDINAGTNEVLHILEYKISFDEAKNIFVKSYTLSSISTSLFDNERLKSHLSGYCLQHFNDKQIQRLHSYLVSLNCAREFNNKSPSEVNADGELIRW